VQRYRDQSFKENLMADPVTLEIFTDYV
jgi:hypothetical protein